MPQDVLDPGPDGGYPYWPRDENGDPLPIGDVRRRRRSEDSPFRERDDVLDTRHHDSDGILIQPPRLDP